MSFWAIDNFIKNLFEKSGTKQKLSTVLLIIKEKISTLNGALIEQIYKEVTEPKKNKNKN